MSEKTKEEIESENEKVVLKIHEEVRLLLDDLTGVINKFLLERTEIENGDKFLIISRVVNYQCVQWHRHFIRGLDVEKLAEALTKPKTEKKEI